jgi:hypothetical protein
MENITSPLEQKKSKLPWLAKPGAGLVLVRACVAAGKGSRPHASVTLSLKVQVL